MLAEIAAVLGADLESDEAISDYDGRRVNTQAGLTRDDVQVAIFHEGSRQAFYILLSADQTRSDDDCHS
ncbi:hypothetical protein EAD98_27790 [Micromonospora sp. CV4]|nr:hypothetical protein EAD98_27790 [Micromonospora sp. CV4]